MFEEEGIYYTSHLWVTGIDNVAFECSFTVPKGEHVDEAEKIISSLEIRKDGKSILRKSFLFAFLRFIR